MSASGHRGRRPDAAASARQTRQASPPYASGAAGPVEFLGDRDLASVERPVVSSDAMIKLLSRCHTPDGLMPMSCECGHPADPHLPRQIANSGRRQLPRMTREATLKLEELQQRHEAETTRTGLVRDQTPIRIHVRSAGDQILRIPVSPHNNAFPRTTTTGDSQHRTWPVHGHERNPLSPNSHFSTNRRWRPAQGSGTADRVHGPGR